MTGSLARRTVATPVAARHLLVVFPHPDDESFATGGTMALHADAGVPVTYLCGTYGDMGRNMGVPFFANRETLREVRERELREACRILGSDVRFMGLRDKTVEFEDRGALAERIRGTIEELNADLVISFHPGYGVHPDHDALGDATRRAVASMAADAPRLWTVAVGDPDVLRATLGPADVAVDVRAFASRKRAALEAHASQTRTMFERLARRAPEDEMMWRRLDEGAQVEVFYEASD